MFCGAYRNFTNLRLLLEVTWSYNYSKLWESYTPPAARNKVKLQNAASSFPFSNTRVTSQPAGVLRTQTKHASVLSFPSAFPSVVEPEHQRA